MNITTKNLAELLYKIADGKKPAEIENIIKKFAELLAKDGYLEKADKVISEFEKIWNEKRGVVEAEVISAREMEKEIIKSLQEYIIKLSGAKEIALTEKVDKKIFGGVVIRYGDRVVDGSLKTRLYNLKERMIK